MSNMFFQTICALIRGVYKKSRGDFGFDIIDILIGFDAAEFQMQVRWTFCEFAISVTLST